LGSRARTKIKKRDLTKQAPPGKLRPAPNQRKHPEKKDEDIGGEEGATSSKKRKAYDAGLAGRRAKITGKGCWQRDFE